MTDLPVLLAGPIIRRAETTGIWIWFATSEAVIRVMPYLQAFDRKGNVDLRYGDSGSFALADVTQDLFRCIRLGEKLWVTLFKIEPKSGEFPTDVILGYNFSLMTSSRLLHLYYLVDDFSSDLCYKPYSLPTLFLPSVDGKLAQGSCRRPGAHGPDAFNAFDTHLSITCRNPERRPSAFFLTGDQIYADDVAYPLFVSVRSLSVDIMGYHELVPIDLGFGKGYDFVPSTAISYSFSKTDKDTRRDIVLKAGFTTGDGEGHLISFGEFAAMYLLVWNPKLCVTYQVEHERNRVDSEWKNLIDFTKRVAEARRVLANIPTYMSFDDHEITDDWNLDEKWVKNTSYGLARRMLTNGLAAYWLFQGWGNVPELRGQGIGAKTVDLIESRLADLLKSPRDHAKDNNFEEKMISREPFAFVAPTKPQVVVTDMRTHREFGVWSVGAHTSLLDNVAYKQLEIICNGLFVNKPVIFVSGSPLLNWYPVMFIRKTLISVNRPSIMSSAPRNKDRLEYEVGDLWEDHQEGRARFFKWVHDVLKPSYCVIFAGDVHHGSIVKGKATMRASKDTQDLWSLDIVNITSSPMKNEAPKLTDKFLGVVQGKILEKNFSTNNEEEINLSGNQGWMEISYDAVTIRGGLMGIDIFRKYPTLVYHNHFCVVDFTNPKHVGVTFYGFRYSEGAATVNF